MQGQSGRGRIDDARRPRMLLVTATDLWPAIHAERSALAADLAALDDQAWSSPSLCSEWTVEEVVAHLTAAAVTGRMRWLVSMVGARFDPARHNRRRLDEQLGPTPAATLDRFREAIDSRIAPSGDMPAWLGEVVVHAEDIRRPLGLHRDVPQEPLTEVAEFYASRDFAVPSATLVEDLRLEATDGPFRAGHGDLVTGPTLSLVMAMAGRVPHTRDLDGAGLEVLIERAA